MSDGDGDVKYVGVSFTTDGENEIVETLSGPDYMEADEVIKRMFFGICDLSNDIGMTEEDLFSLLRGIYKGRDALVRKGKGGVDPRDLH